MFDFYDDDKDDGNDSKAKTNKRTRQPEITKSGKMVTSENISYRPRKNQVVQLLNKNPSQHYVDIDGRIYGFIQDYSNPVLENLAQRGVVESGNMFPSRLMFVFLPQNKKGLYNTKRQRGRQRDVIYTDELLELPIQGEIYELYNYANTSGAPELSIEAVFYPEHINKNVKTALLVCNVQYI